MASGYWRRLPDPTWKGHGPGNEIVYGKTWVDRSTKDKEEPKPEPISETRAEKDLRLWMAWKVNPSSENLGAILDEMEGTINQTVGRFRTAAVPPSVVRGAANLAVLSALKTYNPERSGAASLHTHIFNHLRKVRATVSKYQNLGRIPEHRTYKIKEYRDAKEELIDRIGREPNAEQMADYLGAKWSIAEVARMEKELRKDLISSQNVETDRISENAVERGRERQILRGIWHELDNDEKAVFEYTLGLNGKPMLSAGDIAKKLGYNQPKISRIRRRIDDKLRARGV